MISCKLNLIYFMSQNIISVLRESSREVDLDTSKGKELLVVIHATLMLDNGNS